MLKFHIVPWAFVLVIAYSQTQANPDPPSAFPALSEVQVISALNWSVEVNMNACHVIGASHWIQQGYTDSFVVVVDSSLTLAQFPCKKVMADTAHFSKDGICVLTRRQFPTLFSTPLILSGKYLHLTVVCGNQSECWTVPLRLLLPAQSIIGVGGSYCCGLPMPGETCDMECPTITYQVCNCPSIGSLNTNINCTPTLNPVNGIPAQSQSPSIRFIAAFPGQGDPGTWYFHCQTPISSVRLR